MVNQVAHLAHRKPGAGLALALVLTPLSLLAHNWFVTALAALVAFSLTVIVSAASHNPNSVTGQPQARAEDKSAARRVRRAMGVAFVGVALLPGLLFMVHERHAATYEQDIWDQDTSDSIAATEQCLADNPSLTTSQALDPSFCPEATRAATAAFDEKQPAELAKARSRAASTAFWLTLFGGVSLFCANYREWDVATRWQRMRPE